MIHASLSVGPVLEPDPADQEGQPVIAIQLWGAASLPTGEWAAEAYSASVVPPVKHESEVQIEDLESISIMPKGRANPLEGERAGYYSWENANLYSRGDEVEIHGIGLVPGKTDYLYIYYIEDREVQVTQVTVRPMMLAYKEEMTVDNGGRFQAQLRIAEAAPKGIYWYTFGDHGCEQDADSGQECLIQFWKGQEFQVR
jgi:hypothetical protein